MNISLFANKPFEPGFFKPVLSRPVGAKYATGDLWRKNSRKNEDTEPMQNQYTVVHVTGDRNKVWCFKEQYCIGTWNVRSMNEGKLQVMKQETVRVIIYILGISQLKWTGMGEFNSDDHDIYYCGQEFLRSNGVAIMVNKGVQYADLDAISKTTEWFLFVQGKPFNTTVTQVYAPAEMLKKLRLNGSMKNHKTF